MHNTWIWATSAVTEIWPIFAQNGGDARAASRSNGGSRIVALTRSRSAVACALRPCRLRRPSGAAIGQVLTIEACRGFRFPPSAVLSPVAPRILGTARKTGNSAT